MDTINLIERIEILRKKDILTQEEFENEKRKILSAGQDISIEQQALNNERVVIRSSKDASIAYLMLFTLGFLSVHRIYLGQYRLAVIQIVFLILNLIVFYFMAVNYYDIEFKISDGLIFQAKTTIFPIFYGLLDAFVIFSDIFFIKSWIRDYDSGSF